MARKIDQTTADDYFEDSDIDLSTLDTKTLTLLARKGNTQEARGISGAYSNMERQAINAAGYQAGSGMVTTPNMQQSNLYNIDPRSQGGQTFEELSHDVSESERPLPEPSPPGGQVSGTDAEAGAGGMAGANEALDFAAPLTTRAAWTWLGTNAASTIAAGLLGLSPTLGPLGFATGILGMLFAYGKDASNARQAAMDQAANDVNLTVGPDGRLQATAMDPSAETDGESTESQQSDPSAATDGSGPTVVSTEFNSEANEHQTLMSDGSVIHTDPDTGESYMVMLDGSVAQLPNANEALDNNTSGGNNGQNFTYTANLDNGQTVTVNQSGQTEDGGQIQNTNYGTYIVYPNGQTATVTSSNASLGGNNTGGGNTQGGNVTNAGDASNVSYTYTGWDSGGQSAGAPAGPTGV